MGTNQEKAAPGQKPDEMLQIDLCGGQVRVMLCETTRTVQTCADLHACTPRGLLTFLSRILNECVKRQTACKSTIFPDNRQTF